MKKFVSAIIMTALVGLGLVATSSSPASAACAGDPYASCINTTTTVRAPAQKRAPKSIPIRVTVVAAGTAIPQGAVTVVVTKVQNGRVKYNSTLAYAGGQLQFTTQSLKRGTYAVTATFNGNGSIYNASSASTSFVVKKRRK